MEISVLMCVRNGEKFIKQTIESILKQTYKDFEFIIVINCSTDRTKEIINEYTDTRIKLYQTDIGQLSYNLNFGLSKSIGKYIVRIDADDIAKPERIEKQLNYMKKHDIDVLGSNIDYIDDHNNFIKTVVYPKGNSEIRKQIFYKAVLAHPAVMFKKSAVMKIGGYLGGRYAQDYDLWLRLMRDNEIKFHNFQESLLNYRIHSNQTKGNKFSYAEVSGYLLKETLYTGKIKYMAGSIIYFVKGLLK